MDVRTIINLLKPKSMKLISAVNASYAEHGQSHSGGVVGFDSDTSCYFGFTSSKQPVVAMGKRIA